MAITLYDATVRMFLQTLRGAEGFMAKGLAHCGETGLDPEQVVETRLIETMAPFRFQIQSLIHHTKGAVAAMETGEFKFSGMEADGYEALQRAVSDARAEMEALTPHAVEAWAGRDVAFRPGSREFLFVAEDFLTSFSLPNLYFHATTAYDIIRMTGAPIGKLDFLGPMQLKSA